MLIRILWVLLRSKGFSSGMYEELSFFCLFLGILPGLLRLIAEGGLRVVLKGILTAFVALVAWYAFSEVEGTQAWLRAR